MTEQKTKLTQIFAECWNDAAVKTRFMDDPKSVLEEHGLEVPEDVVVKVVENSEQCVHITLPAPPPERRDLTDDELGDAAGGSWDSCNKHSNCTLPDGWFC